MTNNFFIHIKKYSSVAVKGFTLMETLVAVMILSVTISGALTLAQKGIQAALLAKNRDTAFSLAQDAVEYVRFVRDTNKLRGNLWLAGLNGTANGHTNSGAAGGQCVSSGGTSSCVVDALKNTTTSCSGGCAPINFDGTNDYFSNTSGTASAFTRTVTITTPVCDVTNTYCNASEATLNVTVTWCDQASVCATTPRSVVVQEEIFDWQ